MIESASRKFAVAIDKAASVLLLQPPSLLSPQTPNHDPFPISWSPHLSLSLPPPALSLSDARSRKREPSQALSEQRGS